MENNCIDNLRLWESVEKTDPTYTKEFSGAGGFSGTAINATYLVKKATEILGPIGVGWGYEIEEERYDTGGPLFYRKEEPVLSAEGMEVRSQVHTIKLRFWYIVPGTDRRGELVHFGHTPYVYTNKYGVQTDQEAPKKSLTDALKKCMSMVGFAGDIFMGMFDDVSYTQHIAQQFAVEKAEDRIEAQEKKDREYAEWKDRAIEQLTTAVNLSMLEAVYKSSVRKMSLKKDNNGLMAVEAAKDKRKAELDEDAELVKPTNGKKQGDNNDG